MTERPSPQTPAGDRASSTMWIAIVVAVAVMLLGYGLMLAFMDDLPLSGTGRLVAGIEVGVVLAIAGVALGCAGFKWLVSRRKTPERIAGHPADKGRAESCD